jgi:hypothetical protein
MRTSDVIVGVLAGWSAAEGIRRRMAARLAEIKPRVDPSFVPKGTDA